MVELQLEHAERGGVGDAGAEARAGPRVFDRVHPGLLLFPAIFFSPLPAIKVPVDEELVPGC